MRRAAGCTALGVLPRQLVDVDHRHGPAQPARAQLWPLGLGRLCRAQRHRRGRDGLCAYQSRAHRAIVEQHSEAAHRFSEITIAFHIFVVGAWYQLMFGNWALILTAAVLIVVFMLAQKRHILLTTAVLVSLASFALFAAWGALTETGLALPHQPRLTMTDLALFAPASLVGFALCPYLDLTFHRARQQTAGRTGSAAFALGFGGVFLTMIVFSLCYWALPSKFIGLEAQHGPGHPDYVLSLPIGIVAHAPHDAPGGVHHRPARARSGGTAGARRPASRTHARHRGGGTGVVGDQ